MKLSQLTLLLGVFTWSACGCPDNWVSHGNFCYHYSHDKEDWPNARSVCKALGGHLAEINDAAEGTFLASIVKTQGGSAFWLSLNDLEKEGEYVWMNSGTRLTTSSFTDWSRAQPNNYMQGENCVVIGYNGQWFDDVCSDLRNYICEKSATSGGSVFG